MRLIALSVGPGKEAVATSGRFFRLLDGVGNFRVEVEYFDGGTLSSDIISGIGVDLSNPDSGQRFKVLRLTSDTAQKVRVIVSEFPTTDNRTDQTQVTVLGNETLNAIPETNITGVAQNMAANLNRKKIYLSAPDSNAGRIWVASTVVNSGLPLEPGDVLMLDITGQIDFIGTNGDKLHGMEVI